MDPNVLWQRPSLLNSFLFCKRQFYLNYYYIRGTNKLLKMGSYYHEEINKQDYPVNVDNIDWKRGVVHEHKKGDLRKNAVLQTYLYLKIMNMYNKRIKRAKLTSIEKHKVIWLKYPDEKLEKELQKIFKEIENMNEIPPRKPRKYCKNCSLYDYCWVEE